MSILSSAARMATPADWGPPLWRLLHGLAERLERTQSPMMLADQRNAWLRLLKTVDAALPCAKCSGHYKGWRTRFPPEKFGYNLREASRKWLWSLHNEVNQERGIESPALETMEAQYGSLRVFELRDNLDKCMESFQKAIVLRIGNAAAIHEFKRAALIMLRLT